MMSREFYASIIQEERKKFGITNERLKDAARTIGSSYSKKSLKKGSTYLDYKNPEYRCAYLYKYANLHSGMVTKYFRKIVKKKEIKHHFQRGIKICSLGGGPGTDIVGIFKALAVIPYFHNRINQVSVLDICGGWFSTFENVILNLIKGKLKDVPETFISMKKFKHEFIEIDLLESLPVNATEIISKADIICVVKFISVIMAKEGSLKALKVLGSLLKPGAIMLFIDNYQGNVFESIKDILNQAGLETVLGPLCEVYIRQSQHDEKTYGCLVQTTARITVACLIKKETKYILDTSWFSNISLSSWSEQESSISTSFNSDDHFESSVNVSCDKSVQTQLEDQQHCEVDELPALMEALLELLEVMKRVKINRMHSCCHSHQNEVLHIH